MKSRLENSAEEQQASSKAYSSKIEELHSEIAARISEVTEERERVTRLEEELSTNHGELSDSEKARHRIETDLLEKVRYCKIL